MVSKLIIVATFIFNINILFAQTIQIPGFKAKINEATITNLTRIIRTEYYPEFDITDLKNETDLKQQYPALYDYRNKEQIKNLTQFKSLLNYLNGIVLLRVTIQEKADRYIALVLAEEELKQKSERITHPNFFQIAFFDKFSLNSSKSSSSSKKNPYQDIENLDTKIENFHKKYFPSKKRANSTLDKTFKNLSQYAQEAVDYNIYIPRTKLLNRLNNINKLQQLDIFNRMEDKYKKAVKKQTAIDKTELKNIKTELETTKAKLEKEKEKLKNIKEEITKDNIKISNLKSTTIKQLPLYEKFLNRETKIKSYKKELQNISSQNKKLRKESKEASEKAKEIKNKYLNGKDGITFNKNETVESLKNKLKYYDEYIDNEFKEYINSKQITINKYETEHLLMIETIKILKQRLENINSFIESNITNP